MRSTWVYSRSLSFSLINVGSGFHCLRSLFSRSLHPKKPTEKKTDSARNAVTTARNAVDKSSHSPELYAQSTPCSFPAPPPWPA